MCLVLFVCQQMLAQKPIFFALARLNKNAFSSQQKYEIQAENPFSVFDVMCFANALTTPKIQTMWRNAEMHCG